MLKILYRVQKYGIQENKVKLLSFERCKATKCKIDNRKSQIVRYIPGKLFAVGFALKFIVEI